MPGAPPASNASHSSVAISMPTSRTAAGSSSTASRRSVTAVGSAIPVSSAIRWICLMLVTGMMPGSTGMSQPSSAARSTSRK